MTQLKGPPFGGLLFALEQLPELGEFGRDPPRLVFGQQLG